MIERIPGHRDECCLKRVLILVMDGMGVGEAPDAAAYGDEGSCTLGHLAAAVGGLDLPHLGRLGLGNIIDVGACRRWPNHRLPTERCGCVLPARIPPAATGR